MERRESAECRTQQECRVQPPPLLRRGGVAFCILHSAFENRVRATAHPAQISGATHPPHPPAAPAPPAAAHTHPEPAPSEKARRTHWRTSVTPAAGSPAVSTPSAAVWTACSKSPFPGRLA